MRRRLALASVLAALGPAAAAQAATTVGSDLTKAADAAVCAPVSNCTYFTGDATTGAPTATAPFSGIVVRWRVKSGSSASAVKLRILHPAGGGKYGSAGAADTQSIVAGTSTFATRLPITAGDVIALDDSAGAKLFASGVPTAAYFFQPFLTTTTPQTPSRQANRELLVNADIEHDDDGDGYGDETQDLCPGDPTRHTACLSNLSVSIRPEPAPLTVGRPLTFTIKVANEGPSAAQDVGLTVNFPFSVTMLQARAGRGFCGGGFTVTCRLGAIDNSDSATVVLTVRPEVVGTVVVTATATTSTAQSSADDDAFTSDVTVLPPTLRLIDLRLSAPVFRVGGRTAIKWYMTDAAAVAVKLEQISRRGRYLPRGSFSVRGRAGPNAVLFRGRMPRHKPLKPGGYRFTVSAATADGRVATPGQLGFTVLHRHRR